MPTPVSTVGLDGLSVPLHIAFPSGVCTTEPPVASPFDEMQSARQARLALLGAGLLAQVNTAVANMVGAEGDAARIEWEYAQEVRRA